MIMYLSLIDNRTISKSILTPHTITLNSRIPISIITSLYPCNLTKHFRLDNIITLNAYSFIFHHILFTALTKFDKLTPKNQYLLGCLENCRTTRTSMFSLQTCSNCRLYCSAVLPRPYSLSLSIFIQLYSRNSSRFYETISCLTNK